SSSLLIRHVSLLSYRAPHHRYLHSFPTRRSSDLPGIRGVDKGCRGSHCAERSRGGDKLATLQNHKCSTFPDINADQIPSRVAARSEEHTSELQSPDHLVCRLLLEKKNDSTSERSG